MEKEFLALNKHAMVAQRRSLRRMQKLVSEFLANDEITITAQVRKAAEYSLAVAKSSHVVDGSRDCVAVRYTSPETGKDKIAFAFRGKSSTRTLSSHFPLMLFLS